MTESQSRWPRFETVTLQYAENTLSLAEFEDVVSELNRDFMFVGIKRRIAGPMAGGLYGDPALAFILGALAASFLSELSKDTYRVLKQGIFKLYKAVQTWANGREYIRLVFIVPADETQRSVHFIFPNGLSDEDFAKALDTMKDEDWSKSFQFITVFEYNSDTGWKEQTFI